MSAEIQNKAKQIHADVTSQVNDLYKFNLPEGKILKVTHIGLALVDGNNHAVQAEGGAGPILDCTNPIIINGQLICPYGN